MWTKQKRRTNKGRFILPVFTVAVLSYFAYHIYHGEYGLESGKAVEKRIVSLNAEYQKLTAGNLLLKKRIALLQDGKIEKDSLDEYARRNLNFSRPNELTIITSKEDAAD
ncbi:MAG: septum formation initiator family protein [Candidatus Tokpelaia sp.]|uniref:FtsB family cell division protein n=1 Tax=Candidatus Tokpelaia sp. TaxID=2233777 RepID=UPI00123AE25F|nr:septum formation initiator family protein [Candidatus Tokpelaia sp.]KAA6205911.1 MAG: septum formation initiator family protein [Candidatus Tokpelaia sp.]KAA6207761.1 MAG: septum formation initiator family protein [Candidatus Tokpelaia sp.]KAA6404936.1 septum formation initiator family protein [Candidatus Tokpelaia sp.]